MTHQMTSRANTNTTGQIPEFPGRSPLIGDLQNKTGETGETGETRQTRIYSPEQWISYRITSTDRDRVESCFEGYDSIVARELSKTGEEHYHAICVIDDKGRETIKKRIAQLELGRSKAWSKKNYKTFILGVSYTIKDGDYKTYGKYFTPEVLEASKDAYKRLQNVKQEELKCKDTDRDWTLTYSNIVRVAQNYHKEHGLTTTDLGHVLAQIAKNTRWIPSPMILRHGLDEYYFNLFRSRVDKTAPVAMYWDRIPLEDGVHKKRARYSGI